MGMLTLAAWLTELAITAATNTTSYVGCLRKPLLCWTPCRQTGLGSSVRLCSVHFLPRSAAPEPVGDYFRDKSNHLKDSVSSQSVKHFPQTAPDKQNDLQNDFQK